MSSFSQPDIDRILNDYNSSFDYGDNEQKLKKRKVFIDDLVAKFSQSDDEKRYVCCSMFTLLLIYRTQHYTTQVTMNAYFFGVV